MMESSTIVTDLEIVTPSATSPKQVADDYKVEVVTLGDVSSSGDDAVVENATEVLKDEFREVGSQGGTPENDSVVEATTFSIVMTEKSSGDVVQVKNETIDEATTIVSRMGEAYHEEYPELDADGNGVSVLRIENQMKGKDEIEDSFVNTVSKNWNSSVAKGPESKSTTISDRTIEVGSTEPVLDEEPTTSEMTLLANRNESDAKIDIDSQIARPEEETSIEVDVPDAETTTGMTKIGESNLSPTVGYTTLTNTGSVSDAKLSSVSTDPPGRINPRTTTTKSLSEESDPTSPIFIVPSTTEEGITAATIKSNLETGKPLVSGSSDLESTTVQAINSVPITSEDETTTSSQVNVTGQEAIETGVENWPERSELKNASGEDETTTEPGSEAAEGETLTARKAIPQFASNGRQIQFVSENESYSEIENRTVLSPSIISFAPDQVSDRPPANILSLLKGTTEKSSASDSNTLSSSSLSSKSESYVETTVTSKIQTENVTSKPSVSTSTPSTSIISNVKLNIFNIFFFSSNHHGESTPSPQNTTTAAPDIATSDPAIQEDTGEKRKSKELKGGETEPESSEASSTDPIKELEPISVTMPSVTEKVIETSQSSNSEASLDPTTPGDASSLGKGKEQSMSEPIKEILDEGTPSPSTQIVKEVVTTQSSKPPVPESQSSSTQSPLTTLAESSSTESSVDTVDRALEPIAVNDKVTDDGQEPNATTVKANIDLSDVKAEEKVPQTTIATMSAISTTSSNTKQTTLLASTTRKPDEISIDFTLPPVTETSLSASTTSSQATERAKLETVATTMSIKGITLEVAKEVPSTTESETEASIPKLNPVPTTTESSFNFSGFGTESSATVSVSTTPQVREPTVTVTPVQDTVEDLSTEKTQAASSSLPTESSIRPSEATTTATSTSQTTVPFVSSTIASTTTSSSSTLETTTLDSVSIQDEDTSFITIEAEAVTATTSIRPSVLNLVTEPSSTVAKVEEMVTTTPTFEEPPIMTVSARSETSTSTSLSVKTTQPTITSITDGEFEKETTKAPSRVITSTLKIQLPTVTNPRDTTLVKVSRTTELPSLDQDTVTSLAEDASTEKRDLLGTTPNAASTIKSSTETSSTDRTTIRFDESSPTTRAATQLEVQDILTTTMPISRPLMENFEGENEIPIARKVPTAEVVNPVVPKDSSPVTVDDRVSSTNKSVIVYEESTSTQSSFQAPSSTTPEPDAETSTSSMTTDAVEKVSLQTVLTSTLATVKVVDDTSEATSSTAQPIVKAEVTTLLPAIEEFVSSQSSKESFPALTTTVTPKISETVATTPTVRQETSPLTQGNLDEPTTTNKIEIEKMIDKETTTLREEDLVKTKGQTGVTNPSVLILKEASKTMAGNGYDTTLPIAIESTTESNTVANLTTTASISIEPEARTTEADKYQITEDRDPKSNEVDEASHDEKLLPQSVETTRHVSSTTTSAPLASSTVASKDSTPNLATDMPVTTSPETVAPQPSSTESIAIPVSSVETTISGKEIESVTEVASNDDAPTTLRPLLEEHLTTSRAVIPQTTETQMELDVMTKIADSIETVPEITITIQTPNSTTSVPPLTESTTVSQSKVTSTESAAVVVGSEAPNLMEETTLGVPGVSQVETIAPTTDLDAVVLSSTMSHAELPSEPEPTTEKYMLQKIVESVTTMATNVFDLSQEDNKIPVGRKAPSGQMSNSLIKEDVTFTVTSLATEASVLKIDTSSPTTPNNVVITETKTSPASGTEDQASEHATTTTEPESVTVAVDFQTPKPESSSEKPNTLPKLATEPTTSTLEEAVSTPAPETPDMGHTTTTRTDPFSSTASSDIEPELSAISASESYSAGGDFSLNETVPVTNPDTSFNSGTTSQSSNAVVGLVPEFTTTEDAKTNQLTTTISSLPDLVSNETTTSKTRTPKKIDDLVTLKLEEMPITTTALVTEATESDLSDLYEPDNTTKAPVSDRAEISVFMESEKNSESNTTTALEFTTPVVSELSPTTYPSKSTEETTLAPPPSTTETSNTHRFKQTTFKVPTTMVYDPMEFTTIDSPVEKVSSSKAAEIYDDNITTTPKNDDIFTTTVSPEDSKIPTTDPSFSTTPESDLSDMYQPTFSTIIPNDLTSEDPTVYSEPLNETTTPVTSTIQVSMTTGIDIQDTKTDTTTLVSTIPSSTPSATTLPDLFTVLTGRKIHSQELDRTPVEDRVAHEVSTTLLPTTAATETTTFMEAKSDKMALNESEDILEMSTLPTKLETSTVYFDPTDSTTPEQESELITSLSPDDENQTETTTMSSIADLITRVYKSLIATRTTSTSSSVQAAKSLTSTRQAKTLTSIRVDKSIQAVSQGKYSSTVGADVKEVPTLDKHVRDHDMVETGATTAPSLEKTVTAVDEIMVGTTTTASVVEDTTVISTTDTTVPRDLDVETTTLAEGAPTTTSDGMKTMEEINTINASEELQDKVEITTPSPRLTDLDKETTENHGVKSDKTESTIEIAYGTTASPIYTEYAHTTTWTDEVTTMSNNAETREVPQTGLSTTLGETDQVHDDMIGSTLSSVSDLLAETMRPESEVTETFVSRSPKVLNVYNFKETKFNVTMVTTEKFEETTTLESTTVRESAPPVIEVVNDGSTPVYIEYETETSTPVPETLSTLPTLSDGVDLEVINVTDHTAHPEIANTTSSPVPGQQEAIVEVKTESPLLSFSEDVTLPPSTTLTPTTLDSEDHYASTVMTTTPSEIKTEPVESTTYKDEEKVETTTTSVMESIMDFLHQVVKPLQDSSEDQEPRESTTIARDEVTTTMPPLITGFKIPTLSREGKAIVTSSDLTVNAVSKSQSKVQLQYNHSTEQSHQSDSMESNTTVSDILETSTWTEAPVTELNHAIFYSESTLPPDIQTTENSVPKDRDATQLLDNDNDALTTISSTEITTDRSIDLDSTTVMDVPTTMVPDTETETTTLQGFTTTFLEESVTSNFTDPGGTHGGTTTVSNIEGNSTDNVTISLVNATTVSSTADDKDSGTALIPPNLLMAFSILLALLGSLSMG